MDQNENRLTTDELDNLVTELTEIAEDNPDIQLVRSCNDTDEPTEDAPLYEKEIINVPLGSQVNTPIKDVLLGVTEASENNKLYDEDGFPELDIDKLLEEEVDEEAFDRFIDSVEIDEDEMAATAANTLDVTPEEAIVMAKLITEYKKDRKYPVYKNLPESMKKNIRENAYKHGIPVSEYNGIATAILDEMIASTKIDSELQDIQEELSKITKMPSMVDLYSEHTMALMDKKLPEMADKIREEEPEKAKVLNAITEKLHRAYDFTDLIEAYDNSSRIRKAVRRADLRSARRACDELNFRNKDTKFKMNDMNAMIAPLMYIFVTEPEEALTYNELFDMTIDEDELTDDNIVEVVEPEAETEKEPAPIYNIKDLDFNEEDIYKFVVAVCESCINMDNSDIVSASYIYYLTKNIIVLGYAEESKTKFSVELICNIAKVISLIREREAEFYATNNSSTDKHKQKRSVRNKGRR